MAFSLCEYSHAVEDNLFGESLVTLSILVWIPNSGTNLDISFTPSGSMGHLLLFLFPSWQKQRLINLTLYYYLP